MAGGITDTGELYSPYVGLVYMFNLIVGTGALTMPKAFATAGWLVSLVLLMFLGFMSYMTTTFVVEAMAAANAQLRWKRMEKRKEDDEDEDSSSGVSDSDVLLRDGYERAETRPILSVLGVNLFYFCIIIYLYGDLAIYAAAVPVSLMQVTCSAIGNHSCNVGDGTKYNDTDKCWGPIRRIDAYRLYLCRELQLFKLSELLVYKSGVLDMYGKLKAACLRGKRAWRGNSSLTMHSDWDDAIHEIASSRQLESSEIQGEVHQGKQKQCEILSHSERSCTSVQCSLPDPAVQPAAVVPAHSSALVGLSTECRQGSGAVQAAFTLLLGPFTFFNVQKTKYLQIVTSLMRWIAFILMIILALIRISRGQAEGHPSMAQLSGIRNLFGVCVYSFMCQHSLPSLITPISKKRHVNKLVLLDYVLILAFYSLLSFTAIYCFPNDSLMDMYTLNFTDCDIVSAAFIRYFLGLFPVFTISTNFPIIAVTLRNNWKTLFHREGGTYPWLVDRIVFPAITLVPPVLVAFCTHDLESLVGITGAYAGSGIQYLVPAFLALCSRRDTQLVFGSGALNKHRSPFHHSFWVVFVLIWGFSCFVFVTANIVLSESKF
ncbi:hypothetical protein ASZ78_006452 [Callipepla squamata]|uniref:Amino acid transporter transmembrane domain-containing protein n=1 Tax=Callipepla squamata TaxID=9009 RepID=A0A226MMJ9_CALSU|nr:hypothetical protein ASZ78_006452 [Callipepla squamata]